MARILQWAQRLILLLLFLGVPLGCRPSPTSEPPMGPEAGTAETSEVPVVYRNDTYGFTFSLPSGWRDYTIKLDEWEGRALDSRRGETVVARGPIVSIVHPNSRPERPQQDIPIMVFTVQQWDDLQREAWHIGAAPIGPSELARNSRYVFALPARYNYAFPEGWEEVEQILREGRIQAFEPSPL